ncbi:mechanosensitive ion channel family protein [Iamia sp. SCSIO 61187]|uniref:mechanosensitive ion channel family protein n=1 Tax=Iamia sp. SCSIO 61187 TaxID=2722752 RepID=UPI001C62C0BA|nr:mechanosensitive ion channel family protein [Iamia sp. SCSIO 61187]QYG94059.1 mechanosensitive ion channel family protein [Iamia sp. SCSIO 61187]
MSTLAEDGREEVREAGDALRDLGETVVTALPRVAIALVVLALLVGSGRLLRPVVQRRLGRRRTPSFARVMSRLAAAALSVVGGLLAVTIVFPSVQPVDLLSGAGIVSVAAGFAFKDILQNLLAGVLLLFRQPFRGGDQIQVGEVAGTVEEITVRETVIRTFDGRRVLIPNATVYTDVIEVQTAHPTRRIEIAVGVAFGTDLEHAIDVAVAAARPVPGVVAEPAPEALVAELGTSAVGLEVLVWCADTHQVETRRVRSAVTTAVLRAFDAEGIVVPAEIVSIRPSAELQELLGSATGPAARDDGTD